MSDEATVSDENGTASRWLRFVPYLLIILVPFLFTAPWGLHRPWQLFGIFVATIVGLIVRPLKMGPLVLLSLVIASATGVLSFKAVMGGFGDTTVWLVVAAFLIAGSVARTGFGKRIALGLVSLLGKSTLGLGYAICGAELVLGPVVPSNTARGGGILAPIVESLSGALDSRMDHRPEAAGRYLILVGAHANLITAAMFLTGMAANPLVSKAASQILGVEFGWGTWALGAIVPGLVGLGLLPLFLYRLSRPTMTDARAAQASARATLAEMGPWTRPQITMGIVFALLLLLWATKPLHGLGTGLVAWIGVLVLLLSGAETWKGVIENSKAWDTLIWLGGLLALANQLRAMGVVGAFSGLLEAKLVGVSAFAVVMILALVYFYSMYGFSMLTAHITALVGAFFAVALAVQAPALLVIALLAYFSNLCGCTTNYSTGPVVIYFGLGFVPTARWFSVGALMSLFHLAIWLTVGLVWWKVIGWW